MLSADGVPVLIHDETLERTTTGCGKVADTFASVLAGLDAGTRHHRAFAGEPVPTLTQALEACADLGLWANVEIKPSPGHESETGRLVARTAAGHRNVLLSSFSIESLHQAAIVAGELPRALLIDAIADDSLLLMRELGAVGLHVPAHLLTADLLRAVRTAGSAVACYTVNHRDEAERLLADGVAAVFTDRPDHWRPAEM